MENGGGLTQSIKSLKEKVKENPYWGEGRGVKKMWSFSIFRQFLTYDPSPNSICQILRVILVYLLILGPSEPR